MFVPIKDVLKAYNSQQENNHIVNHKSKRRSSDDDDLVYIADPLRKTLHPLLSDEVFNELTHH